MSPRQKTAVPSPAAPRGEACGTRAVQRDKAAISWQQSRTAAGFCLQSCPRTQAAQQGSRAKPWHAWCFLQGSAPAAAVGCVVHLQASRGLFWLPRQRSGFSLGFLALRPRYVCPGPEEGSHKVILTHSCLMKHQHHPACFPRLTGSEVLPCRQIQDGESFGIFFLSLR